MKKLSEKQKEKIKEITSRNEYLDEIILERMSDPIQPLPLMYILETRYNEVLKKGIHLEGELAYMKENRDQFSDEMFTIKQTRLDRIKGYLEETKNVMELLEDFTRLGREFTLY